MITLETTPQDPPQTTHETTPADSLFKEYVGFMSKLDIIDAIEYDSRLSDDDKCSMSAELRSLKESAIYDSNYLSLLASDQHSLVLAKLAGTPEGRRALSGLTTALQEAIVFLARFKPSNLGPNISAEKCTEFVRTTCASIKSFQTNIHAGSDAISKLLSLQNHSAFLQSQKKLKEYEDARDELITAFRLNPFGASLPTPHPPLQILNHHAHINISSSKSLRNPCFQIIRQEGRRWVIEAEEKFQDQYSSDPTTYRYKRPLHTVVQNVLETTAKTVAIALQQALDAGDTALWGAPLNTISEALGTVADSLKETEELETFCPRIAVCGQIKGGKSTAINALIGKPLLSSRRKGCTLWPTIICHDSEAKTPTLLVQNDDFSSFLTEIRDLALTTRKEADQEFAEKKAIYDLLSEDLKSRVRQFEDSNFRFKEESTTEDDIKETNEQISDLIRIYNKLNPHYLLMKAKTANFPKLVVAFDGPAKSLGKMEFLDLPGIGDKGLHSSDLDWIYSVGLAQCHGVICIAPADEELIDDDHFEDVADKVNEFRGTRPMIVVGTKSDKHRSGSWSEDLKRDFTKLFFKSQTEIYSMNRVHYCSPALYIGSIILGSLMEKANASGRQVTDEECAKYDSIETFLVSEFGRKGKRAWDESSANNRIQKLKDGSKDSLMEGLPEIIRIHLCLDVMDDAYLASLTKVKKKVKQLWLSQQLALETSSKYNKTLLLALEQCEQYQKETSSLCADWDSGRATFSKDSLNVLKASLAAAKEEADAGLKAAVEATSKRYSPSPNGKLTFENRESAMSFLVSLADLLRSTLDTVQEKVVKKVREAAKEAWKKRIMDLAKAIKQKVKDQDASVFRSLEDDIVFELGELSTKKISDILAQLVTDKVKTGESPNKVRELILSFQPFSAGQKAQRDVISRMVSKLSSKSGLKKVKLEKKVDRGEERRFTEDLVEVRVQPGSASQLSQRGSVESLPPSAVPVGKSEAAALRDDGINFLGFLVRAAVPGSLAQCPTTAAIWPFLQMSHPKIKAEEVIATYKDYMMDAWLSIVEEEAYQSLTGAITASSLVAMKTVMDVIKQEQERLENVARHCDKPLKESALEEIILMQVNYVGAYGAIRKLEERFRQFQVERNGVPNVTEVVDSDKGEDE